MSLWATKEVDDAEKKLAYLATVAQDADFVRFVKMWEREVPELRILNCWMDGVRRELDMRLLCPSK